MSKEGKSVTAQGVGMPAWGVAHSQGTQDFDSKAKKKRRKEAKERASARGLIQMGCWPVRCKRDSVCSRRLSE